MMFVDVVINFRFSYANRGTDWFTRRTLLSVGTL